MSEERDNRKEQRRYKRIARSFSISLKPKSGPLSGAWNMVAVKNISAGGILFNYQEILSVGTELDFKINFGLDRDPIQCEGTIVRCHTVDPPAMYEVAATFHKINPADRERLNEYLNKFHA